MSFIDATRTAAPSGASASVTVARWPGIMALAAAGLALVLLVWSPATWAYAVGYVLGAVVGPVAAVAHRFSFESRQKNPWFVRTLTPGRVIAGSVLVGLAIGLAHAWFLATELAKQ